MMQNTAGIPLNRGDEENYHNYCKSSAGFLPRLRAQENTVLSGFLRTKQPRVSPLIVSLTALVCVDALHPPLPLPARSSPPLLRCPAARATLSPL